VWCDEPVKLVVGCDSSTAVVGVVVFVGVMALYSSGCRGFDIVADGDI
jgi:hypothetical protein